MTSPLRIAFVGQRGVPATYGGIEHHVEQIGRRLVQMGHEVTVFCRPAYQADDRREHLGMRLVRVPTVADKHGEAFVHSALSTARSLGMPIDVLHYHALGPGLFSPLARLHRGTRVVQTIHGLDGDRAKWGGTAQKVLRIGERLSARVPHATIVVSRDLRDHFLRVHGCRAWYIPNGVVEPVHVDRGRADDALRLDGAPYVLFVGRLVPEKAPDLLLRAFARLDDDVRLVIAGGSSHTDAYVDALHELGGADDRVVFAGYVYGDLLSSLYANATAFVLPSTLEGLPLTLLEAISYGIPVIASDIPPHREVLGADGPGHRLVPGDEQRLAGALADVIADPAPHRSRAKELRDQILAEYDWDRAAAAHEVLYRGIGAGR